MRLSLFFPDFIKEAETPSADGAASSADMFPCNRLIFQAGGHREAAIPVPIPNTEVKRLFAEGSAGPARARVGRRRPFPFPFGAQAPQLARPGPNTPPHSQPGRPALFLPKLLALPLAPVAHGHAVCAAEQGVEM